MANGIGKKQKLDDQRRRKASKTALGAATGANKPPRAVIPYRTKPHPTTPTRRHAIAPRPHMRPRRRLEVS